MKLIWILSCGSASEPDAQFAAEPLSVERKTAGGTGFLEQEELAMADEDDGFRAKKEEGRAGRSEARKDKVAAAPGAPPPPEEPSPDDDGEGESAEVETRSWFPETFLWAPRVVTDERGAAEMTVTVPDSLTTWRVLGLAASRDGAQAGDVHTFASTLPVYVDPRVPEKLRQGDRVEVPVRVVNTTDSEVVSKLSVRATGLEGSAVGTVRVPAGGSVVETVTLSAPEPGAAALEAGLEGADALVKPVRVTPTGRALSRSRRGLFGGASSFELETPAGAEYAELSLTVFPGPLGVLKRELLTAGGGGLDDQAYAFVLGATGGALLEQLAASPTDEDHDSLRATRLRAQQKLVTGLPSADEVERATVLLAADHATEDPIAERMAARSRGQLRQEQLGDGSWTTPQGTSLQEFLARTAWICAAVDDPGTTVRCGAVFERNAAHLLAEKTGDAYTAALVLRSGAASEALRDQLRELVAASIEEGPEGLPRVTLPEGVRTPDGRAVTDLEALAAAMSAFDDAGARPLAAAVIASYDKRRGFGDGLSGLLALEALERVGAPETPEQLEVRLVVDGEVVERHVLRGDALRETVVLKASAPTSGVHRYAIEADEVLPGLAWHLDLDAYVPWTGDAGPEGLDIEVEHEALAFGRSAEVALTASAPTGQALVIHHAPPVGFVIDEDSITGGTVRSVDDSGLVVEVPAGHGGFATVSYRGVPTLRGQLSTGPATVALAGSEDLVKAAPPEVWSLE